MKTLFSNPFTDVDIAPVKIEGISEHNKLAIRVKDDEGNLQLAGTVSKGYNLITNQLANETALDIFSRSDYKFEHLKTSFDGKKYLDYFYSTEPIVNNGIKLHLGALLRNTYDGSGKFAFEIFGLNPFCTNQYVQRNLFGFFEIRHTTNGNFHFDIQDAIQNLSHGAENLIAVAPKITEMKNKSLSTQIIKDAIFEDIIPKTKWGDVLGNLKEDSVFGLYQSLTSLASHTMEGVSSIHYGQLIGNHFLPVSNN